MGTSEAKGVAAEHLQVTRRSLVQGLASGSVAAVRSPTATRPHKEIDEI